MEIKLNGAQPSGKLVDWVEKVGEDQYPSF
jgi:hypothetical protein